MMKKKITIMIMMVIIMMMIDIMIMMMTCCLHIPLNSAIFPRRWLEGEMFRNEEREGKLRPKKKWGRDTRQDNPKEVCHAFTQCMIMIMITMMTTPS